MEDPRRFAVLLIPGMVVGLFFLDRVEHYVLGLPLVWMPFCVILDACFTGNTSAQAIPRRAVSQEARSTAMLTSPISSVEAALISGFTPSRTWL